MSDAARRVRRKVALIPIAGLVSAAAILLAEARLARRRVYLADPDFDIALVVGAEQQGAELQLVVLGDSTVAGVGVDRLEDALAVQIAERVAREVRRPVRVVAHGVSGARVADVADGQAAQIRDADVVVLEVGSNDVLGLTRLGVLEQQLERLLLGLRASNDIVVLGGSGRLDTPNFLPPLRQLVVRRARQVRRLQASVARRTDVGFVDIGGEVAARFALVTGHTSSDGFHPAAAGYGVWADALAHRVVERLRSRDADPLRPGASGQRLD